MPSKRILSWSKRQSGSEPYYRTGGLLAIDSVEVESCNDIDAKTTLNVEKRRPPNLTILPSDDQRYALSPSTIQYSPGLVSAASGFLASDHMLRSPVPTVASCSRSASIQKPLPSRPRSASVPSIAELPAELPGSILLENGGYSSCNSPILARRMTQIIPSESHPPCKLLDYEKVSLDALNLASAPIAHARSVPELSSRFSATRTMCSSHACDFNALIQPDAPVIPQKHPSSELGFRRRSLRDLVKSPSPMEGVGLRKRSSRHGPNQVRREVKPVPQIKEEKVSDRDVERRRRCRDEASSRLDPTRTHNQHIDKSRTTIDSQNKAVATLQTELDNLKAASEAQVRSLVQSHLAEVASLRAQLRLLEEQDNKQGLQKTPDSNYLAVQDTANSPRTPTRKNSQNTVSSPEFLNKGELEGPQRSPQWLETSPDMENLKRKLSTTRRPETTARNLLPELNQFKQNNAALQKQIECLMAKLNESKKNERELRNTLGMTEMRCAELEDKAGYADKLAKTTQALQNTVDHLESRLEAANIKRIDAEEQLSSLKHHKSPFDLAQRELHTPPADQSDLDAHTSMSTVFSNTPSGAVKVDYQENSKLAALIAHVQRLQDQVSEKDAYITELEKDRERMKERHDHLEQEHNKATIQSDMQDGLLQETRETDRHVEQLRAAVISRDAMIKENYQNTRALERQLEHHKLLLQAEIRRHAAIKVYISEEEEPLPELTALARREDIDRWMEKLHERLRRERSKSEGKALPEIPDAQMESLRHEIDFYVREIILFKLDIKGYKSDIRKLKKLTAQTSNHGQPSDNSSEASSRRRSATPVQQHVAPTTPELDASNPVPPVMYDTTNASRPRESPTLPSRSASSRSSQSMAIASTNWPARDVQQHLGLEIPRLSWQLAHTNHYTDGVDHIDSGMQHFPNAPLSIEHQKLSCASNSTKKRNKPAKDLHF
ncbi:hypothetical protein DDE83_006380 [Stemphylium lycopersici]|uniref:Uncharacterized protein n=1 Tax=Stemphylium lycopersici TaxID=183478 RepID=A0A364MZK7_STELY|nr:hypothetical protein DDE83_006380 [Stemphylium lycopersici]